MYSIHRKFIVSQGQSLLKILHLAIDFFAEKRQKTALSLGKKWP